MPLGLRAGVLTHWQTWGNGPRKALFMHCKLARASAWAGLAERLGDLLSIEAFDLPGHGDSADWDGAGDYQDLVTAIAASFLDGPTDLVGHSFSATVALRLAEERPELVRSLTLIEPTLFAAARAAAPGVYAAHLSQMGPYANAMAAGDLETAAPAFLRVWGDATPWEEMPERRRASLLRRIRLIDAGAPALFDDRAGLLRPGRLEALRCPVLLAEGDRSPPIVAAVLDALAARLPKARRLTVAGAGHMLPITHPRPLAEAMRAFL